MSQVQKENIQTEIAQIIERSRHHEEMFLTDSKTAALQIIQYLQKENVLSVEQLNNFSFISNN